MSTGFKDVAKAAAALAGNPKAEQEVRAEITRSTMVSSLLSLRVEKGMTQEQVAESMQCDSSKISRLEAGNDLNLKWLDIIGYLKALNMNMTIMFSDPSMPAAERIQQSVFRIHADLEELCSLAQQVGGDDKIAQKIHRFYGEVLFNFVVRYKNSYERLTSVLKVPPQPVKQRTLASPELAGEQKAGEPEPVGC